jgi:hypothetical protein
VAKFVTLGHQIAEHRGRPSDLERQPLCHGESISLDGNQLSRIIAQEAHGPYAWCLQYLNAYAVVTLVSLKSEPLVGLHGIEAIVLKVIRANLIG